MSDELWQTYEQEHELLVALSAIHSDPWSCDVCGERITAASGWKPRVAFVFNEQGVHRAIVGILCAMCQLADGETWKP